MRCTRWEGLMRKDHLLDMGQSGEMWAQSWCCMNCGAIYDAVIEEHRLTQQTNAAVMSSSEEPEPQYLGAEAFVRPAA